MEEQEKFELNYKAKIAQLLQENNKDEAEAISNYTELLAIIPEFELEEDLSQELMEAITEIIADELNHQQVLNELYIKLTEIEPNKE